ncbi:hypothetical protein FGO68_gene15277 [Halteria grandinella]|uniref:Uncharacterized protein n=1 Tax=Halteria grandinella TaxID=5974 RepID=A0A8J8NBN6_HALGN|nr:hypothetical protein FGO68_gene15277 [Halteria grandinella]
MDRTSPMHYGMPQQQMIADPGQAADAIQAIVNERRPNLQLVENQDSSAQEYFRPEESGREGSSSNAQGQGQGQQAQTPIEQGRMNQGGPVKGVLHAQINHSSQTIRVIDGSPRELLLSKDIGRVSLTQGQIQDVIEDFDMDAMISDSVKHYYATYENKGFKKCTCSSCQKLKHSILIKENRDPSEYEEIHKAYLGMFTYQGSSESLDANAKIQNVKVIFY